MNKAQERLLTAIQCIQREKRAARRIPDHVMLVADKLYKRVEDICTGEEFTLALAELADMDLIVVGRTINDTYVRETYYDKYVSKL